MIALLISSLLSLNAHASSRTENELQTILKTRSVAELNRSEREAAKLDHAHADCEAELKTHLLPRSCFRELRLRAKDAHTKRAETFDPQTTSRLSKICVNNAKASRSRLDLSRTIRGLPDECKKVAAERLEDLHYIDEAERPELSVMRTLGPDIERSEEDVGQLD